jgi:hypothetical protein
MTHGHGCSPNHASSTAKPIVISIVAQNSAPTTTPPPFGRSVDVHRRVRPRQALQRRLAEAALQVAVAGRGGKDALSEVVTHTDQGSGYTAKNFQAACARLGIKHSMGRAGSALDNAVIESWQSTVEFELRQLEHFATKDQARTRVATWIEEFNQGGGLRGGRDDPRLPAAVCDARRSSGSTGHDVVAVGRTSEAVT